MRTISRIALAAALAAACGCGRGNDAEEQDARIAHLEQSMGESKSVERRLGQEIAVARGALLRTAEDLRQTVQKETVDTVRNFERLGQAVEETGSRVALLEARVQALENRQSAPPSSPPPTAEPAPVGSDFIEPPAGPEADLFPLRVTEVAGGKVVAATHTTAQYVPDKLPAREEFGTANYTIKETEVEDYVYEVSCTLENLTRTAKDVVISAGESAQRLSLQPGETRTNVSVIAAMGADLSVAVGGYSRRFPVTY